MRAGGEGPCGRTAVTNAQGRDEGRPNLPQLNATLIFKMGNFKSLKIRGATQVKKSFLTKPSPMDRHLADWAQLTRRGFVLGLASLPALKVRAATPSCVLTSEQEEGPYYIDGATLRRNITEGKDGVPLTLRIVLMDSESCSPLPGAAVDIWHCDAVGIYSGFTANSMSQADGPPPPRGGPPPDAPGFRGGMPPGPPPDGLDLRDGMPPPFPGGRGGRGSRTIDPTRFLRGVQITNAQGIAEFGTVYPGWYAGRTIHIHLKVRVGGDAPKEVYSGGHVSHTGQLFFPEDVTEQVAKLKPYVQHQNVHRTTQEEDGIFRSQHGSSSIVKLEKASNPSGPSGFVAIAVLAVDPELTPRPVGMGGRGPGRPPPPLR